MRTRLFSPPALLLFALLNVAIGADLNSAALMAAASLGVLVAIGMLIGRWTVGRQSDAQDWDGRPRPPTWWRILRGLVTAALVLVIAFAESIVLHVALDPWVEPPPGPVRGEISAHGPDFGKGVTWHPDLCRPATNPGVMAAALMGRDDPFPVAWIVGRPGGGIAAIDVQRSASASTIRFDLTGCTRLHGDFRSVVDRAGTSGLTGYADAECVHGDDSLTVHVDFDACAAAASSRAAGRLPGSARNAP